MSSYSLAVGSLIPPSCSREAVRLLVDAAFDLTLDLLAQANKLGGIVNGESSLADEH